MLGMGAATRVYLATGAMAMRKGFEALHGLVRDELGSDPLSGLWVCAKRLEKGRFHWPEAKGQASVSMWQEELTMLLSGMDLKQAKPRRGWLRKQPAA